MTEKLNIYSMYLDKIFYNKNFSSLQNATQHLYYIKTLGFNAVHVLPFFSSLRKDKGYDITNHMKVDNIYGTDSDFEIFITTAKMLDILIFIDLVLNHVSNEHEWFINATKGNKDFQNYFIHTEVKPVFLKQENKYAFYTNNNEVVRVEIMFPHEPYNFSPHWTEKNGVYYYHTFYSFQPDLNWANVDLVESMKKVLKFWTRKGLNFRLDATSFIDCVPYKNPLFSQNDFNFNILKFITTYCRKINPRVLFLGEIVSKEYIHRLFNKGIIDYAMSFDSCIRMWKTLIFENKNYILPGYGNQRYQYVNYLKSHDELNMSLECNLKEKDQMKDILLSKNVIPENLPFSDGISGTVFSMCENNIKYYKIAILLLYCMKNNSTLIFSGDEKATKNYLYSKSFSDNRDISRTDFVWEENKTNTLLNYFWYISRFFFDHKFVSFIKTAEKYILIIKYVDCVLIINLSSEKDYMFTNSFNRNIIKVIMINEIETNKKETYKLKPKSALIISFI